MARLLLGNVRGPQGAQGATGPQGPQGVRGPTGPGVPSGGSQGMALVKTSGTDYDSQWKDLLASPSLTGTPTAPTAPAGTKTTQLATTAFATQADEALQEQVTALGNMDTAIEQGIAILATGNTHAAITSGQYVFVRNHSTLANGLYKASANIAANAALSTSNLVADSSGGLNSLKAGLDTLNSNFSTKRINTIDEFKSLVASIPNYKQESFMGPAVVSGYVTGYSTGSVSGIITKINASVADIIWTTNGGRSSGSSRYDVSADTITINDINGKLAESGTVVNGDITASLDTVLANSWTEIGSITLPEGVWAMTANVTATGDNAFVVLRLYASDNFRSSFATASTTVAVTGELVAFVKITSNTTVPFSAYGINSPTLKATVPKLYATRII